MTANTLSVLLFLLLKSELDNKINSCDKTVQFQILQNENIFLLELACVMFLLNILNPKYTFYRI